MTQTTAPAAGGPTSVGARALGPDLARGLLLLFIALANTHGFLHPDGVSTIRNTPIASTLPDQVVSFAETTLVDGRSYTLFAALFGYGMVQVYRRQEINGRSWKHARALLRRRGRWLIVLGVLHAVLLYYGDILAAYGILAVLLVPAVRSSSKRLLVWAGVWAVVGAALYGALSAPVSPEGMATLYPWASEHNPLVAMLTRAVAILVSAPALALTAAGAFLIGIWAARIRLFEQPEQHLVLLRRMVLIGIPVSVLGGVPLALYTSGILHGGATDVVPAAVLHSLTGVAGGPAYAALISLWALRAKRGRVVTALQATGQRSLTCYVSQSVVWAIAFFPYLLDLGPRMALWQTVPLAVGTWALTVLMADWMRRAGHRGPLEVLLRRLTYRAGGR
ncbi:protein of unknown function DUF418 [Kribbella flavida DSM 17836]|uniref:DUF418 domain-containing protein n=1 Tax=Kribbella flavida (strain DSM 17836 / JCM 10339 / NBRC 14399) TaxID=479435 RepID=D2PSU6_KRIFD|nr:DUF418 domain-containing protein [Kribbella flavida]ADB34998.1 protein of unknown function DUF418 [Kribbella flavida DSM 17836]